MELSHQVPWTCAASGPFDGHELHLLLHWGLFIVPVPVSACCDSGNVAATLASEDQGKKSPWVPRLLHSLGNQVSHFLLERPYIFQSLPFITNIPINTFLIALDIPGRFIFILTYLYLYLFKNSIFILNSNTRIWIIFSRKVCKNICTRLIFKDFRPRFQIRELKLSQPQFAGRPQESGCKSLLSGFL